MKVNHVKHVTENTENVHDIVLSVIDKCFTHQLQCHIWHLVTLSAQDHEALGNYYEKLTLLVDELAEHHIAHGGIMQSIKVEATPDYDKSVAVPMIEKFKINVSDAIKVVNGQRGMNSIEYTLIRIIKLADVTLYRLRLI